MDIDNTLDPRLIEEDFSRRHGRITTAAMRQLFFFWDAIMRTIQFAGLATVALLNLLPSAARGEIQASFGLDHCTWNATHIVVVTEGKKIDGIVEVLESWRGDVKPGEKLTLPELAEFESDKSRVISRSRFGRNDDGKGPSHVTGNRMILFLRRSSDSNKKDVWISAYGVFGLNSWGLKVSVAWIERGELYAFQQKFNPGPCELVPIGTRTARAMPEAEAKAYVKTLSEHKALIQKANSLDNRDDRVKILVPLTKTGDSLVSRNAIEALGNCGTKGVPPLRSMLRDESLLDYYHHVTSALNQTGKEFAGPALTEILAEELAFWRKTAPDLRAGWSTGTGQTDEKTTRSLQVRFHRLGPILEALDRQKFDEAREVVAKVIPILETLPRENPTINASLRYYRKLSDQIVSQPKK